MVTEILDLDLFSKSILLYYVLQSHTRGKKKKRLVLIRRLSTNAAARSKTDSCTQKIYFILKLWITVK